MNRIGTSAIGIAALVVSAGLAVAAPKTQGGTETHMQSNTQSNMQSDTPSRPSTTGMRQRSDTANTKGANNPKFCPPGQKRKPGRGSAFNC
jgi:hypothetical protein